MKAMTRYMATLILLLAFPFPISAHTSELMSVPVYPNSQSSTASLSGTVVDEHGAAIIGAVIIIENIATQIGREARSNDLGFYVFPSLPPGIYNLTVRRDGFAPIEIRAVTLNVNDQRALEVRLKVGNVSDTLTITGDSGIQEQAAVGTVIDRQFVENLPLNGRSFQSLLEMTPGTVLTRTTADEQGQFSINGQRQDANYFTVDGVSANIGIVSTNGLGQSAGGTVPGFSVAGGTNTLVSVDALQEFKIQTSTYAPEFGRFPGGQIQMVTRSGTNNLHGTMFEYLRNDIVDANDWFANRNGLRKPPERLNDFGFVLGGPVELPRLFGGHQPWYDGRNRSFFFFSYEGQRLRQPQTAVTEVPSVGARDVAPPGIKPILNAFPVPNGPDLGNNKAQFAASYSNPSTLDAVSFRFDQLVSKGTNFFLRYNHAPSDALSRSGSDSLSSLLRIPVNVDTLTGGAVSALTSTLINDVRVNWSKTVAGTLFVLDNFGGAQPPADSVLFPPFSSSKVGAFLTILSGLSGGTLLDGVNADNKQRQINVVDTLSLVEGSHQIKVGMDYRRLYPIDKPAGYTLAPIFLGGVNSALTGVADLVVIDGDVGPRFPIFTNLSLFIQDTWKATNRLTVTYGLRYELNPPPHEKNGNDAFAVTNFNDPARLGLAPRGTPLYKTAYNDFAPRIGATYEINTARGRETVIRGGFGIFYNVIAMAGFAYTAFPFTSNKLLFAVPYPLSPAIARPDPLTLTPPVGRMFAFDPNLNLPRTYEWNVALEQALGANQSFSASYIGAAGRRLLRQDTMFNPNANFAQVNAIENTGSSDYHALQLQFRRRLSAGLQVLGSYTWSHSIDTASMDTGFFAPVQKISPDLDKGPSDFDVRHSLTAAVTYDVPAHFEGRFARSVFGGWGLDWILRARSATPVNILSSQSLFGIAGFIGASRPNLLPGVPLYVHDPTVAGGRRINAAAFSVPPTNQQGNLGRNSLRGFAVSQLDLGVRRRFDLTERVKLQFRAEFFNLLNHPNFGNPVNDLTSAFFGQSIQTLGASLGGGGVLGGLNPLYQVGGPRSIEFGLKFSF